ncbi:hypothetical protein EDB89DRAFT_2247002 [Lactarius sanguifluus]|nr:hypothetical protein EDB89DRAFT_2247002 [Lactarius sanguifluus]
MLLQVLMSTSGTSIKAITNIAAQASRFKLFSNGNELAECGTSAAMLVVAGIISLLNDWLALRGQPPLGFLKLAVWRRLRSSQRHHRGLESGLRDGWIHHHCYFTFELGDLALRLQAFRSQEPLFIPSMTGIMITADPKMKATELPCRAASMKLAGAVRRGDRNFEVDLMGLSGEDISGLGFAVEALDIPFVSNLRRSEVECLSSHQSRLRVGKQPAA